MMPPFDELLLDFFDTEIRKPAPKILSHDALGGFEELDGHAHALLDAAHRGGFGV
jgi:hypothetical protein